MWVFTVLAGFPLALNLPQKCIRQTRTIPKRSLSFSLLVLVLGCVIHLHKEMVSTPRTCLHVVGLCSHLAESLRLMSKPASGYLNSDRLAC